MRKERREVAKQLKNVHNNSVVSKKKLANSQTRICFRSS
jgi:hypothetical protein